MIKIIELQRTDFDPPLENDGDQTDHTPIFLKIPFFLDSFLHYLILHESQSLQPNWYNTISCHPPIFNGFFPIYFSPYINTTIPTIHPDFILYMLGITMLYDHFLPFLQNFRLWPYERAYRLFLHWIFRAGLIFKLKCHSFLWHSQSFLWWWSIMLRQSLCHSFANVEVHFLGAPT